MNVKININMTKKLAPIAPGIVKHFARNAARLHGLLAFREQLNLSQESGRYETFEEVEADMEEVKLTVVKTAVICGTILSRMNTLARKNGLNSIVIGLEEASVTDIITAINYYVDELVSRSDYMTWSEEMVQ